MQPHTSFKRYIAALIVGGLITALLFFVQSTPLPTYAAALQDRSTPTIPIISTLFPTQSVQPTSIPTSPTSITSTPTGQQTDCPGAQPTPTEPAIEFCSPRFKGDAEGPYGTHIILLGRNIPGSLVGLYLLQVPVGKPAPSVQINNTTCVSSAAQCFPVDNVQPTLSQVQNTLLPFKLSFNWTIGGADPHKDYYAVLAYRDHNGKTHAAPAVSPFSFTLLSQEAPCIIVAPEPGSPQGCPVSDSTLQLMAGSTVYVYGKNWYSGNITQKVKLELSACQQQSCQAGQTFSLPDGTPNKNGDFTETIPLNMASNTTYQIRASNYVPNNVAGNTLWQADNALTFGHKEQGDAFALNLNIVHPCIMVTSEKPSQATQSEQAPANCTQPSSKSLAVTAGESFYLQGFYWLTSQENKITVQIDCAAKSCPGSKLKSPSAPFTAQQGTPGYFYLTVPVPADSSGTYTIKVNQRGITYTSLLTLQITQKPPVTNTLPALPLLALLPAVISLFLYITAQRRHTIQTMAAAQSMPDNSVPITSRASLTPPVTRQPPGRR